MSEELYDEWIPGERLAAYDTPRARAERKRLARCDAECVEHRAHLHDGTPVEPATEDVERPDEYNEEHLRALRPDSQPLPTPSDRQGAHDALLADLAAGIGERKLLGLTRYHSLLQAGNGRDSLRDATEEALDLAAYLRVWRLARDEALELLSELRAALAVYLNDNVVLDIAAYAQPADLIAKVRQVEHLLGGGTRADS